MIQKINTYSSLVESSTQLIQDNYTIFKYIIFMPKKYKFATQAAVQVLATWKADIFAGTIHRSSDIWTIEEKGEEPVYHTFRDNSEIKTLENTFKYRIGFAAISDYWAKLRTFDGTDMRVAFIDYNNYIWLVNESGDRKGFKQSLVGVHLNINGVSYIDITLDRLNTWTGVEVIDLGFDISDIIMTKPVVTTGAYVDAEFNGTIINDGGSEVTGKGFLYSKSLDSVQALRGIDIEGKSVGNTINALPKFTDNDTYYFRAYATNSVGTGVGAIIEIVAEIYVPDFHVTVTTDSIVEGDLQIEISGTVDVGIDVTVNEKGFVYSSIDTTPTIAEGATKVVSSDMSETITGLESNTLYYFRAYADTSEGIVYGSVLYATTNADLHVTVTTDSINVDGDSISVTGTVDVGEDVTVSEKGFVYSSIDTTPTIAEGATKVVSSDMSETVAGLENTMYYFRAYADTSEGIVYGDVLTGVAHITQDYAKSFSSDTDENIISSGNSLKSFISPELIITQIGTDNFYLYLYIGDPVGSYLETDSQYKITFKQCIGTCLIYVRQRNDIGSTEDMGFFIPTLIANDYEITFTANADVNNFELAMTTYITPNNYLKIQGIELEKLS